MSDRDVTRARAALLAAGAAIACYTAVAMVVRPSMYPDSGWGFLVWDSLRKGAPFNHALAPDPADIARDTLSFMTTWSPGQYVFPGLVEWLGGDLGQGIVITAAVTSVVGLIGWYRLYLAFGFAPHTAAVAVALIAGARFFALPYGIYTGGEGLLFAAGPWIVLSVWTRRDLGWRDLPYLVTGLAVLCFMKLSGVILGIAALAGVVLRPGEAWLGVHALRRAAIVAAAVTVFGLAFHFVWLSRGWTAASAGAAWDWAQLPGQLALSVTAIWSASLSLGELAAYLFLHPSRPLLASPDAVNFALAPVAIAACILTWRRLGPDYAPYRQFLLVVAAAYIAVLALIAVRGGSVSPEERHLRPASLLLLVGMVHVTAALGSRVARMALAGLAGMLTLYGALSYGNHALANLNKPLDARGHRHAIADQAALDFLARIDHVSADGSRPVVLVPSPEIGLVIKHARVMSNHADWDTAELLAQRAYRGRVPRLYVLIQTRLIASGKAAIILQSFKDYRPDSWREIPLGQFTVFAAEG